MKPFLDLVLAGEACQDDIGDFVDQWHDGDASCSLAALLGMSDDAYSAMGREAFCLKSHSASSC